ncbi:type II secretion system protein [Shewanella donghaensis]|uniref:type II secretion system protein n=1 Tax=Shewanella donghaensis TaxID=238836 RepID=UPI0011832487|nr:type II secretion system protein [Shewanella donghaensis]
MHRARTSGFTLIELVVVIIILGVLAVSAAPKFLDLSSEGVIATSENLKGVINSTSTLVYSKSVIEGVEKSPSAEIMINGQLVEVVYGYPAGTKNGISAVIDFDEGDWNNNQRDSDWHSRASVYPGAWIYWHGSFDEDAGSLQCYLRYRQSVAVNARPIIDFEFREC